MTSRGNIGLQELVEELLLDDHFDVDSIDTSDFDEFYEATVSRLEIVLDNKDPTIAKYYKIPEILPDMAGDIVLAMVSNVFGKSLQKYGYAVPFGGLARRIGSSFLVKAGLDDGLTRTDRPQKEVRIGALSLRVAAACWPGLMELSLERYNSLQGRRPSSTHRDKKEYVLKFNRKIYDYISAICLVKRVISPPMLCQPRDWVSPTEGGYLSSYSKISKDLVSGIRRSDYGLYSIQAMPKYYRAINHLQMSEWKIDRDSLDLIKYCRTNKIPVKKFPFDQKPGCRVDHPLSKSRRSIPREEWTDYEREAVSEYYMINGKIREDNEKLRGKILGINMGINIAEKYSLEDRIWFPHYLDYRGRVYPTPAILNTQASDPIKSLLTMACPEPISSPEAERWAKIHIANLNGQDKLSYDDRVKWFDDHEGEVLACGRNPYGTDLWHNVDKPWQYIQACREWNKYRKNPKTPVSIMIAMDGSCSGIQHLSAILRDPVGGRSVNLVPGDKPQDIYRDVADVLQGILDKSFKGHPYYEFWQSAGIGRSLTKRPVMTTPYGVTSERCKEYVRDYLLENCDISTLPDSIGNLTGWLRDSLWRAMQSHLKGAAMVMEYLKSCVTVACKDKDLDSVQWMTPDGFTVVNHQRKTKDLIVNLGLSPLIEKDRDPRITAIYPIDEINSRKIRTAISPNFVHSYDANHLIRIINSLKDEGIMDICAIHDSISVHVNHADTLYRTIRETFIELYKDKTPLQDFVDHMKDKFDVELPNPPILAGDQLDFDSIMDSKYFFS